MNAEHERYADWDAAYVLGALSPAERREYEGHLESCDACLRSVAELAPMPGLLSRLTPERATALLDAEAPPAAAPKPELLDAVRLEARRRGIRRRRRGWAVATVAVAAVVVLAALFVPLAFSRPAPGGQTVAFDAVADVPVTATAVLTPVEWGTRIALDCTYETDGSEAADAPEGGWPYALVVVDRDGNRTQVSSWRAMPGATARLQAATAVDVEDISSLEIRGVESARVLLTAEPGEG
ncbi:hypothetical protein J2X63_003627 [Agromyces sp. 3263]|uniref:anti-sigma factor family protein n=1 Tax=Agromyces sp. 3263 TaxID=2817750 RepID=UPI002855FCB2|nr:zf-HC2 domain-containing protein [Agromyces sp. 3263]MDR6907919.1 hypothetical protein [Agromyces sp. 3263]